MEEEQKDEQNNNLPEISGEEMKMPAQSAFGQHDHKSPSHLGIILGILIVVLVLILGGLYLWGSALVNGTLPQNTAEENLPQPRAGTPDVEDVKTAEEGVNSEVKALESVSTSDEIEAIEADIDATDLDSLDAELDAIDAELDSALEVI